MLTKTILWPLLLLSLPAAAQTGRQIMDKVATSPEARTGHSRVEMLIHKGSHTTPKTFEIFSSTSEDGKENKTLIAFSRPSKIKLLTHSREGGQDNQWLRLSSGRIKRVTASGRHKAFVNSHFTFEDLSPRELDDYTYKKLGEGKVGDKVCDQVESIAKEKSAYDRSVVWVGRSDHFVYRVDFYRKGKLLKSLLNHDVRPVDGILTPFRVEMRLANGRGSTELKFAAVRYNVAVKSSRFRKETL